MRRDEAVTLYSSGCISHQPQRQVYLNPTCQSQAEEILNEAPWKSFQELFQELSLHFRHADVHGNSGELLGTRDLGIGETGSDILLSFTRMLAFQLKSGGKHGHLHELSILRR